LPGVGGRRDEQRRDQRDVQGFHVNTIYTPPAALSVSRG
jgi:hypothetical protein